MIPLPPLPPCRYSEEFERTFMEHLRRAHPFSRIAANVVYNEYINEKWVQGRRGRRDGGCGCGHVDGCGCVCVTACVQRLYRPPFRPRHPARHPPPPPHPAPGRDHVHMNSTKWLTLTEFVKYLGRTGQCKVDETEKGWFIAVVQKDELEVRRQRRRRRRGVAAVLWHCCWYCCYAIKCF